MVCYDTVSTEVVRALQWAEKKLLKQQWKLYTWTVHNTQNDRYLCVILKLASHKPTQLSHEFGLRTVSLSDRVDLSIDLKYFFNIFC